MDKGGDAGKDEDCWMDEMETVADIVFRCPCLSFRMLGRLSWVVVWKG